MQIDGQCHCGRVSYQAEIDPARQIWCRSAVPWLGEIENLPGRPTD
jgi:hypothetical protein